MKKKILITVLACVLVAALAVTGTVAYLTAQTDPVVNTFTVGNINITLAETKTDFKMVPGNTIGKDPVVTVVGGSEACWLFVKVDESTNLDSFITYTVDTAWTAGTGTGTDGNGVPVGVYYRSVTAATTDQVFSVLAGNTVTVKNTVTKAMMDEIKAGEAVQPALTFTAYAVQSANITTAAAAWAEFA